MVMTFAGLALLLSMVGVFGILAYSVQLRVRDFALRRAFGATAGDVLRLVVRERRPGDRGRHRDRPPAVGAASAGCSPSLLFGVRPLDPVTFAFVTALLVLGAALSVAGPAWWAARIDPAVALRNE